MGLVILSFVAGALTVAAPCILPLLPIVVGGSLNADGSQQKRFLKPIVITASLALSVILFTLLLKATTALLGIPAYVWQIFAGGVVILLGLNYLFPSVWEKLASKLYIKSNAELGKTLGKDGLGNSILTGAALGPVFNSCSPTYAFIVAVALPASFATGFLYLLAYALGLSLMLLLVAFAGQAVVTKLGWLSNPKGWFKKALGIIFILVGLGVMFGVDKKIQTYVLEQGWYAPISNLEESLR